MQRFRMRTIVLLPVALGAVGAILVAQERPAQPTTEKTIDLKVVKIPYKMEDLLKPSGLSDTELRGRGIWIQRCAYCHDGAGTSNYNTDGPWLDSAVVKARGDDAVRTKILNGSQLMPGFKVGLSAAQVDQVIAFIKTVSPAQAPTADQKARKVPPLPSGDL